MLRHSFHFFDLKISSEIQPTPIYSLLLVWLSSIFRHKIILKLRKFGQPKHIHTVLDLILFEHTRAYLKNGTHAITWLTLTHESFKFPHVSEDENSKRKIKEKLNFQCDESTVKRFRNKKKKKKLKSKSMLLCSIRWYDRRFLSDLIRFDVAYLQN